MRPRVDYPLGVFVEIKVKLSDMEYVLDGRVVAKYPDCYYVETRLGILRVEPDQMKLQEGEERYVDC